MATDLAILDALTDDSIQEIHESYTGFCATTEALLNGAGDLSVGRIRRSRPRSLQARPPLSGSRPLSQGTRGI